MLYMYARVDGKKGQHVFLCHLSPYFLRQGQDLSLNPLIHRDWLANEPWGFSCLHSPALVLQIYTTESNFHVASKGLKSNLHQVQQSLYQLSP